MADTGVVKEGFDAKAVEASWEKSPETCVKDSMGHVLRLNQQAVWTRVVRGGAFKHFYVTVRGTRTYEGVDQVWIAWVHRPDERLPERPRWVPAREILSLVAPIGIPSIQFSTAVVATDHRVNGKLECIHCFPPPPTYKGPHFLCAVCLAAEEMDRGMSSIKHEKPFDPLDRPDAKEEDDDFALTAV